MGMSKITLNEKCNNIDVALMEKAIINTYGSVQKASVMLDGKNGEKRSHDYLGGYIRAYKGKNGCGKRFPIRILKDLRNIGFDYTPFLRAKQIGFDEIPVFDTKDLSATIPADSMNIKDPEPVDSLSQLAKAITELADAINNIKKEWRITIS